MTTTLPSFVLPGLESGTQWATNVNKTTITVKYTFWTSTPSYDHDASENTNFMAFTATMKQAVVDTLAMISSYCNVNFVEVAQNPENQTQIGYGLADIDPTAEAYTYYPDSVSSYGNINGDVWGNRTYMTETLDGTPDPTGSHIVPGDFDYMTIIHETGHAMGLKHDFERPNPFSSTYDSTQYTVMSYTDGVHYAHAGSTVGYQPETYMPFDIAALQDIYGVNTTYHTGNDVYTLNPDHIYTIWDAGGTDTLDGSAVTSDMTLDLQDGHFSSVAETTTMSQNIAIAYGVTIENANGGSGNDTIYDNAANNDIQGNGGNDIIFLTIGNDTASGGTGTDTIHLGTGNDSVDGGANTDTVIFGGNYGDYTFSNFTATTVDASATGGVSDSFSNVEDFQFKDLNFTSLALLQVGPPAVTLTGGAGADTLNGGAGSDTLSGLGGNDLLNGANGGDTLDGGTGSDVMNGGGGNDTYFVDVATDKIIEAVNGGTDTVISSVTYTLAANLENLTLNAAAGAINGTGNTLNNILTGNDLANTLDGGTGVDSFVGGDGNDTFILRNAGDTVTEVINQGTDTMIVAYSNTSTLTPDAVDLSSGFFFVENVTITGTGLFNITGSAADNVLTGNASVNTLTGGGGNDTLDGGAGADHLNSGAGNDTYIVDNVGDVITDGGGADTVIDKMTAGAYTLAAGLENLTLSGTAALTGIGNTGANIITGNAAANTLNDGGAGSADTLIGGLGNDTYVVNNSGDVITELAAQGTDTVQSSVSFDLSAQGLNVENITLTGGASINATGNTLNNIITGNTGDNVLDDGGAGLDKLIGGAGNDTYFVEVTAVNNLGKISDFVTDTSGVNDTLELRTTGTLTLNAPLLVTLAATLENLDISGTFATHINITGNAASNVLTGNDWDNTITGGAGNDSLFGGDGNDTYILGSATDAVFESGTVGSTSDTVVIAYANKGALVSLDIANYANVENLKVTGTGLYDLTGDANANTLTGNASVNHFTGGDGNDTYVVGTGDVITETLTGGTDTVLASVNWNLGAASNLENLTLTGTAISATGNELDNIITGNNSSNTLTGNDGNDTLLGGLGADILLGGNGNDTLDGGAGADKLTGGAGADVFVFHGTDAVSAANADTILDFQAGAGNDAMNIHDILVGYNGTDSLAGWVHLTTSGANTIVSVDANGPSVGTAHFVNIATLTGVSLATLLDADHMVTNGNLIT